MNLKWTTSQNRPLNKQIVAALLRWQSTSWQLTTPTAFYSKGNRFLLDLSHGFNSYDPLQSVYWKLITWKQLNSDMVTTIVLFLFLPVVSILVNRNLDSVFKGAQNSVLSEQNKDRRQERTQPVGLTALAQSCAHSHTIRHDFKCIFICLL